MPRQPRLDAPGALHHVMGRGIETDKHIPHGHGPRGFCEEDGGLVRGRESHCLCLVSFIEPLPYIGSNGSPAYFQEYEEAPYGVCGQF